MIVDGNAIAEEILKSLESRKVPAITLGVVMDKGNVATDSFVRIKARVAERLGVELLRFGPEELEQAFACDGIIVQLPIPDADTLLAQLPSQKDVDALGPNPLVRAPVAGAVAEILSRFSVEVVGKRAVVVGAGRLVGTPVAMLLKELGAEVSIITQTTGSLTDLKSADLVVSGVGEPGLIQPAMLKPGVVLIDAGTSESAGKLAGDTDPTCAEIASVFTPVPGGVGPIAVAMIFKNLFDLVHIKNPGH